MEIFFFILQILVMGNSFFCNRCDIEKFQLSRACADQFLNEDKDVQSSENRWIQKLKCLDDVHSKRYGITEEGFNELYQKLENQLQSEELPVYDEYKHKLIDCLHDNPHCMLNCHRQIEEFIDCVDTMRIRKMKQRIQESMKKQRHDSNVFLNS